MSPAAAPGAGTLAVSAARRPSTLRASIRGAYILWYRDVVRFTRDRTRFAISLAMPVLYLLVLGTGLSASLGGGFAAPGLNYIQYMYPGIVGMTVLMSGLMGAISIVMDREFGFLREVMVSPVRGSAVAVGKALGGATQALVQGVVIVALAPLVGVSLTLQSIVGVLVVTAVLAFALSSLGVLVSARMRSMQGFQVAMNLLTMPMFFLSGAMFLLNNLPPWMTVLTRLNPAAYGIDALRRVVLGGAGMSSDAVDGLSMTVFDTVVPVAAEVGLLVAFGCVMLALAARSFGTRQ